jgi:hypothetical protein
MTKLMGYNEAYNAKNWIVPANAAESWRKYIQPAAKEMGLDLVAPTTCKKTRAEDWNRDFIYACY